MLHSLLFMPAGLFLFITRQEYASDAFPSLIHKNSWAGLAETF